MEIPTFLKRIENKEDIPELSYLIKDYEKLFGSDWSTAGFDLSDKELAEIFKKCIREKRTFDDIMGWDNDCLDPDDDI